MKINVTDGTFGQTGPTDLSSLEEVVATWNAEGVAYGDLDPDDLPHIVVVGDEVRYYRSDTPGDYTVVATVID